MQRLLDYTQNISHKAWIPGEFYFVAMSKTNAISIAQVLLDLQISKQLVLKVDVWISRRLSAKEKVMDLQLTISMIVASCAVSIVGMYSLLRNICN